MVGIYEWYIDVFFVVNFLMDVAGILAAGIVCNRQIRLARILLTGAGATTASILLLFCLPSYVAYLLSIHLLLNPFMVAVSYRPKSWWDFLRLLLTVYLVLFVAGGVQQSLRIYGLDSAWQILVSGVFAVGIFLVWQIRWRVVGNICLTELEFFGERISLTAFCDSGNLLRDPETGNPVNVVKRNVLPEHWLAPEQMKKKETCIPMPRRIPYRTVGVEKSEMEVLVLDSMKIYRKGSVREIQKPVIGILDGNWMEHPRVDLLLNGAYS